MTTDHRAVLAKIKRFDQLVAYLRDEMGWPIARDSFEDVNDLFYDFTAAELGIDAQNSAKILEIKRLRPLSSKQPWGIFFVKFEPKNLPVVALRRILSQVALKKRPSANSAERTAWAADDLLFISNYGEGEGRQISFAHFSRAPDGHDLPTLKVLGWDNLDTALHLDDVAKQLTQNLVWPDDDEDVEAWRRSWRAAFTLRHREVIATSKELSIRLAELARNIRDRIKAALTIETDKGPLTKLMKAFQEALVHDLDADGFADMYAQTIAYGLLSARIADPLKKTTDDFAAHMRTSPFLRELMETFLKVGGRRGKAAGPGIDFDELGVGEVVELLDSANIEAVVRDFGDRNRAEDPVMHFYELFLHEYNKQLKIQRGVFYTPQPVVTYIVRSVHELLQTEFGLVDGLADTSTWGEVLKMRPDLKLPPLTDEPDDKCTISADEPFVQILDPATGTATFLVEVIEVIYRTLVVKWRQLRYSEAEQNAAWNDYVPKHLLPRLHAFELMMAPYAIAHMKIGLKLAETGYRFGTEERARIYLTNALEPWMKQLPLIGLEPLAHEAAAVNEIKRNKRFTVVIGNPPYSNFGKLNKNTFILKLLEEYKRGLDERKINLDDDFIKFVRFSQAALEKTKAGVLGFITNNVYLEGLTHRQMRQSLMNAFPIIHVLNLHGDQRKKEVAPDGSRDENVFDIMQGVSVAIAANIAGRGKGNDLEYSDLWGSRDNKYRLLANHDVSFTRYHARAPNYFFKIGSMGHEDVEGEYRGWPRISDVAEGISGIETKRDHFAIDLDRSTLEQRIREFVDENYSDAKRKEVFGLRDNEWVVADAVRELRKDRSWEKRFVQCLYRPFDPVWIIYHGAILARDRGELMASMTRKNIGLIAARQSKEPFAVLATNCVCTHKIVTVYDRSFLFPLYRFPAETTLSTRFSGFNEHSVNLSGRFIEDLCARTRLKWANEGAGDLARTIGPEDVFHYSYAIFYSPSYRSRYSEYLKVDFPRLPLTGNLKLFRTLARLGAELTSLHLLESSKLTNFITEFVGGRNPEVQRISWSDETVWLDKAETIGFRGVPEAVWNFHIGGYQVCEKWLKDRKGRTLSKSDISNYQKVVVALSETIRLMNEIDEAIDAQGGWPGAFAQIDGASWDASA